MSKEITIRKGLDINLKGVAEKVLCKGVQAQKYAIVPANYHGVTPKMLVKVGDTVKIGTPLFFDKEHPEVLFTSVVSGTVSDVVRGDKRKILAIEITPDGYNECEHFSVTPVKEMSKEQAKELLLKSGLWTSLIKRPFGIIANVDDCPRDIFISGLDTAPLGVDMDFILQDQQENLSTGIEVLSKLTCGKVHLSIGEDATAGALPKIKNAELYIFKGKHPAGNVGTQIAAIDPLAKGEVVWTINPQHVVAIGKLVNTGVLSFEKIISVAGSQVKKPAYHRVISGAQVSSLLNGNLKEGKSRIISGNPLSGTAIGADGYVGFYDNSVSVIEEGDKHEFIGWAMPRLNKFSASRSYFSWLTPKKSYALDTNLNGGPRALVMNGIYDTVMPLDIYPVYLLKAIMAGDIDKMENLGIYEVIEEDFALCEFVCPSKTEWQAELRKGINLMIKEL